MQLRSRLRGDPCAWSFENWCQVHSTVYHDTLRINHLQLLVPFPPSQLSINVASSPWWQSQNIRLQTSFIEIRGGRIVVRAWLFASKQTTCWQCWCPGLLILNIYLILPLLSSVLNGLDSSMLNGRSWAFIIVWSTQVSLGLQILPGWQGYFHNPQGKILGEWSGIVLTLYSQLLGLINCAQGIGALSVSGSSSFKLLSAHFCFRGFHFPLMCLTC
jgi:hypothetical protein